LGPSFPAFQLLQLIDHRKKKEVIDSLGKQEVVKLPMVMATDTISNPKAVVIISLNTDTALPAMPSSIIAGNFTDPTVVFLRLG
jgi:hypothetical protein